MSRRMMIGLLLISLWFPGTAATQSYRVSMQVPPVTLYETMLKRAERRQFDQVYKSLPFLKQIFEKENDRFGVDLETPIRSALYANDTEQTIRAIRRAIFFDIKDIFAEIGAGKKESSATLNTWFIMARMDYDLLSPHVRKQDFDVDQKILSSFYEGGALLRSHDSPIADLDDNETVDFESLEKIMWGIEKDVLAVLTEFEKGSAAGSLD